MTLHPDTLGIDISKHHLDVYDSRDATTRRIANTAPEVATLAQALTGRDCLVVFEATGHYDGTLRATWRAQRASGPRPMRSMRAGSPSSVSALRRAPAHPMIPPAVR